MACGANLQRFVACKDWTSQQLPRGPFLKQICAHVLSLHPSSLLHRMYQFLSFYQKELTLWMYHNLDTKAGDICLDTELAPAFKVQ
jgi:hypothetical protein